MFTACQMPPHLKYIPEDMAWALLLWAQLAYSLGRTPGYKTTWAGGTIICLVQFEAELTKTGNETEILIFEQTWVFLKPQTHLQNSHNFHLSGRETGV